MLDEIQKFMDKNREWTDKTFPGQSVINVLDHLRAEANELQDAITNGEPPENILFEYADVYLLLLNSISKQGLALRDVHNAAIKKMDINRSRKWVINSEGYSQHVDG